MSIIAIDPKPKRASPTNLLSREEAQRIERMTADPSTQRRKFEAEQEASRQRSTGEQNARLKCLVERCKRLLCYRAVGKPKHNPEPTPLKRGDRTSTFEKGVKLLRRATSVFSKTSISAK
jgi:hypothetical protein